MKSLRLIAACLVLMSLVSGCSAASETPQGTAQPNAAVPQMPAKIQKFEDNVPVVNVYVMETKAVEEMPLETYLAGVLAGEMKNDWPMEALKAQAILARTFALKFMTEKESKYGGADVSTDIEEAQAYAADEVNDRVQKAVEETRGLVLSANGELPYAWFHAHSGGKTALAKEGLNWKDAEPSYTLVTEGHESEAAPEDAAAWQATFTADEVAKAAKEAGATIDGLTDAKIGQEGESGRAMTLILSGQEVNAPDLRIALDSTKMRSTLLTEVKVEDGKLVMAGKGFGHGVGMSQWGAYGLAESGQKAEEIVKTYFQNVEVVKMY